MKDPDPTLRRRIVAAVGLDNLAKQLHLLGFQAWIFGKIHCEFSAELSVTGATIVPWALKLVLNCGEKVNKLKASGGFQMMAASKKDGSRLAHGLGKGWVGHCITFKHRAVKHSVLPLRFLLLPLYTISSSSLIGQHCSVLFFSFQKGFLYTLYLDRHVTN